MGKISGEEGFISLGPWGMESGEYWAYKADGPIMQITIRYGGVIDSIVFESKSSSGVLIGSPSKFGCRGGPNKETFCIDTSVEQLSSISLTYGNYVGHSKPKPAIGSLYFNTDQNTYGVTGNHTSNFSSVSIPIKGGVIAGFHGRAKSYSYINAFGMFVAPKVDHKGKNSGEKGSISIGPWGGEDGVDWAYKLDGPIMQICIRYGQVIESIVFESKSDDGVVIEGSDKIGGDGGNKIKTFCIDSSKEQVSSIILTFGLISNLGREMAIHTLGINTNLRTYGPFGLTAGDSSVSIPIEGGVLTGFHGRLGSYINAIGVFVAPKINSTLPSSGKEVDGLHSNQDSDASTSQLKEKISDKEAEQKKEISGKEGCISLGPWGGEDGKDWVYKPDGPLLQICIVGGDLVISSIVFASKSYDGVVIGSCKKIGRNGGFEIETFCIDTSVEELLSINLTYGRVGITSFSIHTNRNKYAHFGTRFGASSLSIPIKGGVFAGLHGRVGTCITAIGVLLTPKVNSLLSIQDLDSTPKKDPDAAPTHHKARRGIQGLCHPLGMAGKACRPISVIQTCFGQHKFEEN